MALHNHFIFIHQTAKDKTVYEEEILAIYKKLTIAIKKYHENSEIKEQKKLMYLLSKNKKYIRKVKERRSSKQHT